MAQKPATPISSCRLTGSGAYQLQQTRDLLRTVTCGSASDDKGNLINFLLRGAQPLSADQLACCQTMHDAAVDFALLFDELPAQHAGDKRNAVAYRLLATSKREFILADIPDHQPYTRSLLSALATADLAIIVLDASRGLLTETRRYAHLAALMGIQQVLLAVNTPDLAGVSAEQFAQLTQAFESFARPLGFASITAIPISTQGGDNITVASANTPWYCGPTLLACLETIEVSHAESERVVFPVQQLKQAKDASRNVTGTLREGRLRVGDELRASLSGKTARVAEIVGRNGPVQQAVCGDAVTLAFERKIDVSRGDILALSQRPLETTDQFEATLVWLDQEAGLIGRSYAIQLAAQRAAVSITTIKHRVNSQTLAHEPSTQLEFNDISVCTLASSQPLVFDRYLHCRTLGSFILIDRMSNATVAVGMIKHSMRRADNVHRQALSITRAEREKLNSHKGKVIWFTGLSGSGKSTLANALEVALHGKGYRTYLLDGDNVRQGLNKDLGFTAADRVENIRRIAEVAKLMMDAGLIVMTAFISPFQREREMARELIGPQNFVEVYVSTSLEACEVRDVKGLYKKARAGQLPNLSGIGSPYEPPTAADIEINAEHSNVAAAIEQLLKQAT